MNKKSPANKLILNKQTIRSVRVNTGVRTGAGVSALCQQETATVHSGLVLICVGPSVFAYCGASHPCLNLG